MKEATLNRFRSPRVKGLLVAKGPVPRLEVIVERARCACGATLLEVAPGDGGVYCGRCAFPPLVGGPARVG